METTQLKAIRTTFPDGSIFEMVDNNGKFSYYATVTPAPGGNEAICFLNRVEGHGEVTEDDKRLFNSMLEGLEKMPYETVEVINPWKDRKSFSLLGNGSRKGNLEA